MLELLVDVVPQLLHVDTEERLVEHSEVNAVGLYCEINCHVLIGEQHDV